MGVGVSRIYILLNLEADNRAKTTLAAFMGWMPWANPSGRRHQQA